MRPIIAPADHARDAMLCRRGRTGAAATFLSTNPSHYGRRANPSPNRVVPLDDNWDELAGIACRGLDRDAGDAEIPRPGDSG
jgi:hypothetical protein